MNSMLRSGMIVCALACVTLASAAEIAQLKPLYPATELVVGGEARCVIVVPDDAELRAQAEALAAALPAAPEIVLDTAIVSPLWELDLEAIAGRNLIGLGNINTSRLLAMLYGETYVVADSIFPGPDGYVIRTVHDPWAAGINVLVLAGSDAAGVERAVSVFREKYLSDAGDVVLPDPIVDVQFTPVEHRFFPNVDHWLSSKRQPQHSTMDYFRQRFEKSGLMDADGNVLRRESGTMNTVIGAVGRIAQTWFWNGDPALPPLMKQIVDTNRHLLANVPERIEMEGSASGQMHWWDVVEELPVWTDADRLAIINAFYADAQQGYERRAANGMVKEGYTQVVDENHGTNSALNTYNAWRYFEKYYDLPETEYWMSVARAVYAGQCASHQTLEDAAGYLAYAPGDAMEMGLRDRDLRFFELGIARTQAEFIANCCVNNLGLCTGFGDGSGLVAPGTFQAVVPAAWYYRDARLWWVVRNAFHVNCGLRAYQSALPFDLTVEAREPVEWTGMSLFPIWKQTLRSREGSREFITDPREPIGAEWFNKIVFREGWSPDDQFLLLDGAGKWAKDETEGYANRGPSGHKHDDVNTIINYTDEGRMWLVDHTYGSARSIKDHSGIYIVRDGQVGYRVREARLLEFASAADLSLCRSVVEGFSGADWERTIFWRRGEWFLVMDRVTANEPGDYQVRCSFRGLGEAELRGDTMRLAQDGKFCDITTDGRGALDIEDFVFPAQDHWDSFYPWAEGVARVFQQDKSAHLEPGEAITFATLIRAAADEAELEKLTLTPCSANAAIVAGSDGEVLCSVGTSSEVGPETGRSKASRDPALLDAARATAPDYAATRDGDAQVEPFGLDVTALDLQTPVADMLAADLDGDGTDEWLVAGAEGASAFAPDGTLLWRYETEAPCVCVTVGDLDGDGRPEVAVGCEDTNLYLLGADGAERWRFACKENTASIGMTPVPDMIRITDLDGDGAAEVVVGANWVHCLDAAGQVKWERYLRPSRGRICGDFAAGEVVDVEGDGQSEALALYMDSYHKAVLYDAAGRVTMPADWDENHNYGIKNPLAKCLLLADLRGDGGLQFVVGSDQRLYVYWLRGREAGEFSVRKSGCFVDLALTPVEGDTPFLHGANDMGAVVTFRNTKPRDDHIILLDIAWSRAVGEKISRLWSGEIGGQATLLVGTRSGAVHALDPTSGEPVGLVASTGSEVVGFVLSGDTVLAVHADGVMRRLAMPR